MVALCLGIFLKSNTTHPPARFTDFSHFFPLKINLSISALLYLIILFLLSFQIVSFQILHTHIAALRVDFPLWLSASGRDGKTPPKGDVPQFFLVSLSLPTHSVGQSTYPPNRVLWPLHSASLPQEYYTKAQGRTSSWPSSLPSSQASWATVAAGASPVPAATALPKATNCWPLWPWLWGSTGASSLATSITSGASSLLEMWPASWSYGKWPHKKTSAL